eukprot:gene3728-4644_t
MNSQQIPRLFCQLCDKEILATLFIPHLFECLCIYCNLNGFPRFCTCKQCNGKNPHPQQYLPTPKPSSIPQQNLTNTVLYLMDQSHPKCNEINHLHAETGDTTMESFNILSGRICVVCKKKSYPPGSSRIPIINVIKYRLMVCTKKDLTSSDVARIEKYTDLARMIAEKNYMDKLRNGSDDERESVESMIKSSSGKCDGITDLNRDVRCEAPLNRELMIWIEFGKTTMNFCKTTHAVRYLIKNFASGSGRRKLTPKKSKQTLEMKILDYSSM